jgi:hypothetical protein
MKSVIFLVIASVHILIWVFVLCASVSKRTAEYNIYYVIPFIYLVHILPFHILSKIKQNLYSTTWEQRNSSINKIYIIPYYFEKCSEYLSKNCFANPLSPQGMLIFGLLTSIYQINNKMLFLSK